ncbi:phage tail protein [Zymomonas mobilis]|uniref:P2 GpU family protein n=1 Tax=Zymomonas mobilis subsp. mobilis (strain ATCC 31821 / ZM4 / CP4) TaxID=264203 RepID=A0A806DA75_ZYMMO|nr:phage tail protein [Zymomonas mobilis]ADC33789.1 P2 GpU family protein [Zymomonas mobilis subsp. mobilis ZM4 = ATCC 31821]AHB11059.1 phage protein U [Zymomonas mobilis subsp. mobilis str. CP4 = NRRL B-14023]AHJ71426.1 Phage protein U [Zymomonas mobilis subsp. mobilis NRRL B-12526]AHJ73266.1 Phage protein U [Zymomonas mobilis subsp. mobilis str. CP4 = NRRL B-14023]
MLFALGMFTFELSSLAPENLDRTTTWEFGSNKRLGARAAAQFTGLGETVTLSGTVYAEIANALASEQNQRISLKQRIDKLIHPQISKSKISDFLTGRQDQHNQSAEIVSIDALREMADQGQDWKLVDGTGKIYGSYIVTSIVEKMKYLWSDGRPRQIDFELHLQRVDDDNTINSSSQITYV